jgi:hypothetical protein
MTEELTKKLINRFNFFRIGFGFEHSDGWFQIVWDLCEDLEKLEAERWASVPSDEKAKMLLEGEDLGLQVVQVKEKFGTLRFYVENSDEKMYKRISEAEHASATTCEVCGKPGTLNGKSWVRTTCLEHIKKDNRNVD